MTLTKPRYSRYSSLLRLLVIALLMLILCMGVFNATAFAKADSPPILLVNAAWLDGETIRINVTDPDTGALSAIAVPLSAYLQDGENSEFITIQAVDLYGRQSDVIEIRNPFFNPNLPQTDKPADNVSPADVDNGQADSAVVEPPEIDSQPLTPDGTGTMVDNVTNGDGVEFFTIGTEDGNVFYLIIDRQRNADNVYLLNAVTEEDLISLAQAGGRDVTPSGANNSISAITIPPQILDTDENGSENETPEPEPSPVDERPTALSRIGSNLLFFVGVIVVAGGIAYYFKVVRPKKSGFSFSDEPDDYDYDNAADDGDLEDGDDE